MTQLDRIVDTILSFDGIVRKRVLPNIIGRLRNESFGGITPHSLGEDSAAIGTSCDDIVLLTTDSIVEELCLNHPYAAGFNVVLANVMDIYAAGGTPTSFAVALSYSDPKIGDSVLQGLIDASHAFRVPIVRGHTNPNSDVTYVVGSATGTVGKSDLLTAGGAKAGDHLLLLYDDEGFRGKSYRLGWDSVTGRTPEEISLRLTVMNEIASEHLVNASKDISVAGLAGTAGMMVEYSGSGGLIDLDSVDAGRPTDITMEDWLRMYISLGFLLSAARHNIRKLTALAADHKMTAVSVGQVDTGDRLRLKMGTEERLLFDFSKGPVLTPRVPSHRPSPS